MTYIYYQLSKKSDYAIRALFELALRGSSKPINVRNLAKAQDIPNRFLEIILNELKQGGFVLSIRGKSGGYLLTKPANKITIGQIIHFLENPPKTPSSIHNQRVHPGDFVIGSIMQQINQFIGETCDCMSFQDMIDEDMKHQKSSTFNYMI